MLLVVKRGDKQVEVSVRPESRPQGTPMIGVIVSQAADIKLPVDVEIDTDGVGGPSAGLAFALDLMEELGRDVDHGNRIAVTGALELDGTVGEIGGVKQKTIGVERAGIKVFLVPAGDNAAEARKLCGWDPDRACDQFSTGVADAGNIARSAPGLSRFRHVGMRRKVRSFRPGGACARGEGP